MDITSRRGAGLRAEHLLVAAAVVAACSLGGCKPNEAHADPRTADRMVSVAQVQQAPVGARSFTGVVGARVESGLGFRVQGKVVERFVDAGQVVQRGQKLMRIDPTDYNHALVAQTGNVAAARAKWIQAAADERRDRGLVATGAISQSAYDQVKATADAAKALLDAAIAQENVARNQEDYALLLADADGTIMRTLAEPGQVVQAGQVVVQLAHAGPREAVVNLPETVRPALGSEVVATLFGTGPQVPARLRQLSDSADPRTRTFEARYVLSDAGANVPLGATVTVALPDSGPKLLSVPLGAIDDAGRGPGVWVLDAKTSSVAWHPVHVRTVGIETAEIDGGLTADQTIVASGGHVLHQGEKVRPVTVRADMR